jgi:hypothetical protein
MCEQSARWIMHTVIRVRTKKESPDTWGAEAKFAPLAPGDERPRQASSDGNSISREVMASTKRPKTAKPSAARSQRLCLPPPSRRFLRRQSSGCRTGGEGMRVWSA